MNYVNKSGVNRRRTASSGERDIGTDHETP